MTTSKNTFGWELAQNGDLLLTTLGSDPSFHDSSVRSLCLQRARSTTLDDEGKPMFPRCDRDFVDLILEIFHNRFGPRPAEGDSDYLVTVKFLNVKTAEIDANAMMEEAWIRDINLTREPNGSIKFDLNPNLGLDIVLTCEQVIVEAIEPYDRDAL